MNCLFAYYSQPQHEYDKSTAVAVATMKSFDINTISDLSGKVILVTGGMDSQSVTIIHLCRTHHNGGGVSGPPYPKISIYASLEQEFA